MRRYSLLTALFIVSLTHTLQAQAPDTLWTKTYGGLYTDMATSFASTGDDGYIIASEKQSSEETSSSDLWLIGVNSDGDTLWTKLYGGDARDFSGPLEPTSDGGYIMGSTTESSWGAGSSDAWLVKIAANGDTTWTKTFGNDAGQSAKMAIQTSDGGYVVVGRDARPGENVDENSDVWLIKTDDSGNEVWSKHYGGGGMEQGLAIRETSEDSLIVAAYTESFGSGLKDLWLLKTNADGDSLWSEAYGTTGNDGSSEWGDMLVTADGGYLIATITEPSGTGEGADDIWLLKTDSNGDSLWSTTFGGESGDVPARIESTVDGGYLIAGITESFGAGGMDAWLIKTNANGDSTWTKTLGGTGIDAFFDIDEPSADTYLVVGTTTSWGAGDMDGWLVKLGAPGPDTLEQDSLALVALYDSTGGDNWTETWDLEAPVSSWSGVYLANGRVDILDLQSNNLIGTIPAAIEDLTELTSLKLGNNQITEPLPGELGNLSKLTILGLQNCGLTELPSELGNLSALDILYLYNNNLTGAFPSWITNISDLWALDIRNNQLTGPIPTEITNLSHLQYLYIEDNQFDFGDIESFLAAESPLVDFTYSPQAKIGNEASLTVFETEPILLTVSTGGVDNIYQWKKDEVAIPEADDDTLLIESASLEDSGVYTLEVTHPTATDLILTSWPIDVTVLFGTFETDSLALVALYNSTGGPNWGTYWDLSSPVSSWTGVTVANGRVTQLNLYHQYGGGLTGALPAAIGDLTALTSLLLWHNELTSIPPEIDNLVNLTELGLSNNQFTEVPTQIGNLINLEELYLGRNMLTSIPAEIGNLANLRTLGLNQNQLTAIPVEISGLTNLKSLEVYENLIEEIPTSIGSLDSLESLSLYNNRLSSIPAEIGTLVNLKTLSLGYNQLASLPSEIGNLVNLTGLDLNNNQLSSVPAALGNLANLTHLNLGSNLLTTLPAFLGGLVSLEQLNLSGNQLTTLPTELGGLVSLKQLDLSYNLLPSIPTWIFDLASLEYLYFGYNQLAGEIPAGIGNLANLRSLWLNSNQLTGQIPDAIGQLSNLTSLVMFNNDLSGSIPDTIGALVNLQSLQLTNNQLSGTIPAAIGKDTSLTSLDLGSNELTGAVPEEITDLYKLSDLRLDNNQLEDLPDLSSMTSLWYVLVRENRFTFEDLEPNIGVPGIEYTPQDSVGDGQEIVVSAGESITLEVVMGGTATEYQWKKNGEDIEGATSATHTISSVQHADGGIYHLHATNTIVTGLELVSRPIFLLGPNNPPVAGADSAISIPSGNGFSLNVLSYATDPDEDELILADLLHTEHGSTSIYSDTQNTLLTYASMPGYTGPDTVWYVIKDGLLGTDTGRVIITLTEAVIDPPITISQTFGGSKDDRGYIVQQTTDGGFMIAGHTESYGSGDVDAWLIKLDAAGDTVWTKTYGGIDTDMGYSAQQTADGGYVLAGETSSSGAGDADAWLIKTDADGAISWTKTYGGSDYDNAISVQQTDDGGYILAGQTDTYGVGGSDAWLIKTTASGDTSWTRTYGGSEFENIFSVQQTTDGGYILAGQTASFGAGETDIWLIKTDASGDTTWTKTFGGTDEELGYCVQQTSDGGYIIAGQTGSTMYYSADAWLIKTDASGDTTWTQTYDLYGDNAGAHSVIEVPDGGYVVAGYARFSWRENVIWVFGTDALGTKVWQGPVPMGGYGDDKGYTVNLTWNNDVIVVGTTGSFGPGGEDVWFMKIEEESIHEIEDNVTQIPVKFALSQNYPNPFNPITTIRYDLPELAEVSLIVYDLLGREVVRLVEGQVEPGYHRVLWSGRMSDGRVVPTGVYIARLVTPEYTRSIKMVLLK